MQLSHTGVPDLPVDMRPRKIWAIWLGLFPMVAAKVIQTSALLTCMSNSQFSAKQFNAKFDPDSKKISLDASLISGINGNFSVTAEVIIYGIKILEKNISGCDLSETVCPISAGRFEFNTSLDASEAKEYIDKIPGIAYTFPDIDAVVRAHIYYSDSSSKQPSGDPIACVEAQLSNMHSVQSKYVSWGLFGVILLGVVVAGIATLLGHVATAGHIVANTVSLFSYFQNTAIIAMMAVAKLPPIAASWAENFVWTLGIIQVGFMQDVMTWYVRSTGGTPTNILPNKNIISIAAYKRSLAENFDAIAPTLQKRVDLNNNYTTTNERDSGLVGKTLVVQGVERAAYLADIELSNFFVTGATFFLFIGLCLAVLLAGSKGILELLIRTGAVRSDRFEAYRIQWRAYTKGMLFRYFLIGFTQLSFLSLWEFTSRESVATTIDAVVMYAVLIVTLCYATVAVIILARNSTKLFKNPAYILYGNPEVLDRWGFLYVQFRATAYWFLVPILIYSFVKSAVIALGQSNGKVQAVFVFVVEILYLILICWIRPYMDKSMNIFNISIASISFVNSICFLFFSQLFGKKADVASAIVGVVFFIINAVFSFVLLVCIIVACVWALLHRNPDARYEPVKDDRDVFMPDIPGGEKAATELDDLGMTARDGFRESFLHYKQDENEYERAGSGAPQTAAHRLSGYEDGTHDPFEDSYPSYREYQSTGILGSSNEYDEGNHSLLEHHNKKEHSHFL